MNTFALNVILDSAHWRKFQQSRSLAATIAARPVAVGRQASCPLSSLGAVLDFGCKSDRSWFSFTANAMGGMSSQVLWKQRWSPIAEATLSQALADLGCLVHELTSQEWDPKTSCIGGIRDYLTTYLAPASPEWSSAMLHLNSFIGELLGAELSRAISGPAITFLEYDQASWGYVLFDRGDVCDRFWNMPEIVEVIPGKCAGDVDVLLRAFSAPRSQVAPYLSHAIDPEGKAFDDDEFTLGDHWVRVDFMRRLGLSYPDPGRTLGGRYVQIHEPRRG